MRFDFIASTGRTATTWLASVLNDLDGVTACHEGYTGAAKGETPLLPLINLENAQAYAQPASGARTVAAKRSPGVLAPLMAEQGVSHLIDVAYYNAVLAPALLAANPDTRMIGIIRDCEGFVRSATAMTGEDPLPVGWPDPDKPLSDREKFIAMGRIRPNRATPEKADWPQWSAIRRNIWLWQETNLVLARTRQQFPDRVRLCRFETFRRTPERFWAGVAELFALELAGVLPETGNRGAINKKPSGYQIGPRADWTAEEQAALDQSQTLIEEIVTYDC